MHSQAPQAELSRRERQIMNIVHRLGRATAAEVLEEMPDAPSYSAVRAMLRILEEKGHVRHAQEGKAYVYVATHPAQKVRRSALRSLVDTFFEGSTEKAVAALLDLSKSELSDEELERMAGLIAQARKEGR
jgi:predicted transcriptional regulator